MIDTASFWTLWQVYAPFVAQFLLAILGGGIISAYLTEKWTRRRERVSILIDHVSILIRNYHIYIRALNRSHSLRTSEELDQAHAAFYAEAKLLGLSSSLKVESEELINLADVLFSIRKSETEVKAEVEAELRPVFETFSNILDDIQQKLQSMGAL